MKALVTGKRSWPTLFWRAITKWDLSHGASVSSNVPKPKLQPDEILVKVRTVALNPTDWKHIDLLSPPHAIIGCDYAGEVAELGSAVPSGSWKVGERVAGVVHGGLYKDSGAFAEYLRVPYDLAFKPPRSMSDHDAATYGVSSTTPMLALYHNLSVPWPDDPTPKDPSRSILIYGGSTASGLYALQMAKHAGLRVATTCSPHSFDLVKKYGADSAFDYRSTTLVDDIVKEFPDVDAAMDCISEGPSSDICAKVIAANGGKGIVIRLLGGTSSSTKNGVEKRGVLAYTLMGEPFQWLAPLGPKWPAVPEDRVAAVRYIKILPEVMEWLKPIPTELVEGGWEGLERGLEMLKKGKVSGRKLVVDLA